MRDNIKFWIHNHYHWIIALVVFLQLVVFGGIMNNYSSLFVIPVTESLEISRGSFSLAVSVKDLVGFVATMFTGVLLFRFGYRKMILLGMSLAALSFALLAYMNDVRIFALGNAILGLCSGVCFTAGSAKIINDWFWKHRGLILGLVSMSTGLGGSVSCVLLTDIIEKNGWRAGYRFIAILFFLIIILIFFTIRNRPAEMGLTLFGEGEEPQAKKKQLKVNVNWPGFYTKELLKRPMFYLMAVCTLCSCLCAYVTFYVVVPHMQGSGFSAIEAAAFQSTMLLVLAAGKLFWGGMCDRIGARRVSILCVMLVAVGQWLLTISNGHASAWTGIVLYSLGLPLTSVTIPLLTMSLVGYRSYDMAVGVFLSMVSVGAMVAQPVTNFVYDKIGTYSPVFRAAAIFNLVVIVLYLLLYKLADRDRTEMESECGCKREEEKV